MNTNELNEDTAIVSEEGVTVERDILRKEEGIAGELLIRSDGDESVIVHVVDEIPDDITVEDVAFKPGDEPDMGDASSRRVSCRQTVTDEPVRITYGILTSHPVTEMQWDPPEIRDVSETDVAHEGSAPDTATSGVEIGRSTGDSELFTTLDDAFDRNTVESNRTADAGSGHTASTAPDRGDASASENTPAEGTESSADAERSTNGVAGSSVSRGDFRATEGSPVSENSTTGGTARAPDVSDDASGGSEPDETASDATPEERNDDRSDRGVPRSVEIRLDRISARVEEFTAYATALEGLINEHGTGTEVVDRIDAELDDMEARLDALRDEVAVVQRTHAEDMEDVRASVERIDGDVERANDEVERIDGDVERIGGDVERLDDDVERLDDEVSRVDSALGEYGSELDAVSGDVETIEERLDRFDEDIASVRDTVETVEADIAAVRSEFEDMRDELENLQQTVARLDRFRQSLAELSTAGGE